MSSDSVYALSALTPSSADTFETKMVMFHILEGDTVQLLFRHIDSSGAPLYLRNIEIFRSLGPFNVVVTPNNSLWGSATVSGTLNFGDTLTLTATATANGTFRCWSDGDTNRVRRVLVTGNERYTAHFDPASCPPVTELPYVWSFLGSLNCWTPVDINNDGRTWHLYEDGEEFAVSYSIDSESGAPIRADEYLISPQIVLPEDEYAILTWSMYVASEDSLTLLYSTTGNDIADFTGVIFDQVLAPANRGRWVPISVNLAVLAGQTIYLAFRHHTYDESVVALREVQFTTVPRPQYQITAESSDPQLGTVDGGGTYYHRQYVTLTATPAPCYTFTGWSDGVTENPRQFMAFADTLIVANFALASLVSDTVATACDAFTWYGITYTDTLDASGARPYHSFTTADGCDSTVFLHLTINHSSSQDTVATACDAFTWRGTTYTASGSPQQVFTNAVGCDSTITLHLTIVSSGSENSFVTACDSYEWLGTLYTESGTYTESVAVDGCEGDYTLHLTINPSATTEVTESASGSYTWNGETYTESGTYTWLGTTAEGCDSTVTLHLTIEPLGIGDASWDGIVISVGRNNLTLSGVYGERVRLYDAMGRRLHDVTAVGGITLRIPAAGVYLLSVGNRPARRIVATK